MEGAPLPPEDDTGNIEYKSHLVNPSQTRLYHLITQMNWRLREGNGRAIYKLGINDDGSIFGLSEKDLELSLLTLKKMSLSIDASISLISKKLVRKNLYTVEVLVRQVANIRLRTDIKVALLGNAEAGKSTLAGVLTHGVLDNGRGQSRINLFRYLHEFRSGKTSSISLDVIGFTLNGEMLNYEKYCLVEILEKASKLVTLIDLAGDRRYLKTTIYGVSAYRPHFTAILINARTGTTPMTKEHLGLAVVALDIPFFIVVTKVDLVSAEQLDRVFDDVNGLVQILGKCICLKIVQNKEDAEEASSSIIMRKSVPVFTISNVTGKNIDLLTDFLSYLPRMDLLFNKPTQLLNELPLFYVKEVFCTERLGVVLYGYMEEGVIREGCKVKFGPNKSGGYSTAVVDSIQNCKQPVVEAIAGDTVSLGLSSLVLKKCFPELRKGMVCISKDDIGQCCRRFVAKFYLLYHPQDEICVGFKGTVYIGTLRRTVTIVDFNAQSIPMCKWLTVTFEFGQSEFIRVGMPLIFRESRTKAMGQILEICELT